MHPSHATCMLVRRSKPTDSLPPYCHTHNVNSRPQPPSSNTVHYTCFKAAEIERTQKLTFNNTCWIEDQVSCLQWIFVCVVRSPNFWFWFSGQCRIIDLKMINNQKFCLAYNVPAIQCKTYTMCQSMCLPYIIFKLFFKCIYVQYHNCKYIHSAPTSAFSEKTRPQAKRM